MTSDEVRIIEEFMETQKDVKAANGIVEGVQGGSNKYIIVAEFREKKYRFQTLAELRAFAQGMNISKAGPS